MQGVKSVTKQAFMKSIPIMCSYIFVSMAYGMMMENAANAWFFCFIFFHRFSGKSYTICIGDQETEVTLESNYTEL